MPLLTLLLESLVKCSLAKIQKVHTKSTECFYKENCKAREKGLTPVENQLVQDVVSVV